MRKRFCKLHKCFLSLNDIQNVKNNRCWTCKHSIEVGNSKVKDGNTDDKQGKP
nr:hypothetical protein DGKKSRWO_DGKKSRWO_CDS_0167 [uncultured phage]CAI9752346.1 hypothetical protein CVNMHQAP_CVNMHQAP_CDS_0169 [uncultured phage]